MSSLKTGWARPGGKWHIFIDDVSVCGATGLGRIKTLLNAPTTERVCRKCVQWNKDRVAS